jgi:uncharacterized protein DUF2188
MAKTTIRVVAANENVWVVQEEGGRELGQYPTKASAEAIGRTLARKRGALLLVEERDGRTQRKNFQGLFRILFAR